jgi:hypothetical protein
MDDHIAWGGKEDFRDGYDAARALIFDHHRVVFDAHGRTFDAGGACDLRVRSEGESCTAEDGY